MKTFTECYHQRYCIIFFVVLCAFIFSATSCRNTVRLTLPREPKVDLRQYESVGVIEFDGDLRNRRYGWSVAHLIEKQLRKSDHDWETKSIRLEKFLDITSQKANSSESQTQFWQRVGREFGVEVLIYGDYEFKSEDKSGYYIERWIDERTGQIRHREVYEPRFEYFLKIKFYIVDCREGKTLTEKEWSSNRTIPKAAFSDINGFYKVLDDGREEMLSIILPEPIIERFYLFK